MEIQNIKITDLTPYEKNTRRHKKLDIDNIAKSIEKYGFNDPIGSDMADSITGGGLHGKDLSKSDVSVNIYAFCEAQRINRPVELSCAIGDDKVNGIPYLEIVKFARKYIKSVGGFEKFAGWGLF